MRSTCQAGAVVPSPPFPLPSPYSLSSSVLPALPTRALLFFWSCFSLCLYWSHLSQLCHTYCLIWVHNIAQITPWVYWSWHKFHWSTTPWHMNKPQSCSPTFGTPAMPPRNCYGRFKWMLMKPMPRQFNNYRQRKRLSEQLSLRRSKMIYTRRNTEQILAHPWSACTAMIHTDSLQTFYSHDSLLTSMMSSFHHCLVITPPNSTLRSPWHHYSTQLCSDSILMSSHFTMTSPLLLYF